MGNEKIVTGPIIYRNTRAAVAAERKNVSSCFIKTITCFEEYFAASKLKMMMGMQVMSGQLYAPGVPNMAENVEMQKLVDTYGKTWHTWQVDRGDPLPLGTHAQVELAKLALSDLIQGHHSCGTAHDPMRPTSHAPYPSAHAAIIPSSEQNLSHVCMLIIGWQHRVALHHWCIVAASGSCTSGGLTPRLIMCVWQGRLS